MVADRDADVDAPAVAIVGTAQPPELGWGHTWASVAPPYPGVSVVPVASPPAPPRLDGADTEDEWVALVLATWSSAVSTFWARGFTRAYDHAEVAPGTKGRARLAAFAWACFEEEIPPAMWIRFMLAGWWTHPPEGVNPKRTPPRWRNVLNADTLRERLGWFRKASSAYGATAAVIGPRHRALMHKHNAMTEELVRAGDAPPDELRAIVTRHFPGDTWGELVADAVREARSIQCDLDGRVKRGEWSWR